MPQTFVIDQAASFAAVAFLSASPKQAFGTQQQETAKDGTPKWTIEVIAGFRDNFGKIQNEVMKVGYTGLKNPAENLGMYTPVQLINFTVGVMDKTTRDKTTGEVKVIGAQVWYRCDDIRPVSSPPAK